MVGHTPVTFCGQKNCGIGNKINLVCHVISQFYLNKKRTIIIARSLSRLVISLQCLMVIDLLVAEI